MKDKGKIIFLPIKEGESSPEHYGLKPVKTKYSEKHGEAIFQDKLTNKKLSKKWYVFMSIIFLISLSSIIFIQPSIQEKIKQIEFKNWYLSAKSHLTSFMEDGKEKKIEVNKRNVFLKDSIERDRLAALQAKLVEDSVHMANNNPMPFQVIIGSFPSKELAEKEITKLKLSKEKVRILEFKEQNKFRLSIAEYADKDFAKMKLDSLKNVYNKNIWILSL